MPPTYLSLIGSLIVSWVGVGVLAGGYLPTGCCCLGGPREGADATVSTGFLITVPGGQPQLVRITSSVGSSATTGRSVGCAIRSISRSQERSPMLLIGWLTVVRGGS